MPLTGTSSVAETKARPVPCVYRIDIGMGTFAAGVALTCIIALLSVGYQAYKAAVADPVVSLKNE